VEPHKTGLTKQKINYHALNIVTQWGGQDTSAGLGAVRGITVPYPLIKRDCLWKRGHDDRGKWKERRKAKKTRGVHQSSQFTRHH